MPNKELGIADPVYDALRIRSGQSIAPDLGGGSTGAGGIENKIYVWHADGSSIDLFDPDAAGMALAIAAAASGDTIWLPACTIGGDYTVPANVALVGISREQSVLTGQVTLSSSSIVINVGIVRTGTSANLTCLVGPGSGTARAVSCKLSVTTTTGTPLAATSSASNTLYLEDCDIAAIKNGAAVAPFSLGGESLVDTFTIAGAVSSYQPGTYVSLVPKTYRIECSGVIQFTANAAHLVDANYTTTDSWATHGTGLHFQFSDGSLPAVDGAAYSGTHVYNFTRQGTGAAFSARFFDSVYTDNSGSWTVNVYEQAGASVNLEGCVLNGDWTGISEWGDRAVRDAATYSTRHTNDIDTGIHWTRAELDSLYSVTVEGTQPPIVAEYDSVGADYVVVTDDSSYNAFPGFVKAANGNFIIVYRKAVSHVGTNGTIVQKTSTDGGLTWSAEATIVNETGTYDARDPCLTLLANGDLVLAYSGYIPIPATGSQCWIKKSTDNGANWGTAINVASGLTYRANPSTNVVELANGDLLLAMHGSNIGDTYLSATVSKSTDAGATWAHLAVIANGEVLTKLCEEPNIVLLNDGSLLCVMGFESLDHSIHKAAISTSTNSGATWSAVAVKFDVLANTRLVHLADDNVICTTLKQSPQKFIARLTSDAGSTWSDEVILDNSTYVTFVYSEADEIYPGLIGAAYAIEFSSSNCDIRFLWMVEGDFVAGSGLAVPSLTTYNGNINVIGGGQIVSTLPTGTAPLVIASTTKVDNLNADMVDGLHASQLGHTIQDEGAALTQRSNLNFVGTGVTATDDAGNNATVITVPNNEPINVYNETQSADGTSLTYYLTNYAAPSTIRVYIDGIRQPASDDSAATDVVTFDVAPDAGALLLFDYEMDTA